MLWALIMQPHKVYSQHVEKSFHLTMASLNAFLADDHPVQVMVSFGDATSILLCTLSKHYAWQVPLNLHVEKDTFITLWCNGTGIVHLTGYQKNTALKDPDVVLVNVSPGHMKKGVTSLEQAKESVERHNSKRKASSSEDEAAKRMKPSANSNEESSSCYGNDNDKIEMQENEEEESEGQEKNAEQQEKKVTREETNRKQKDKKKNKKKKVCK